MNKATNISNTATIGYISIIVAMIPQHKSLYFFIKKKNNENP